MKVLLAGSGGREHALAWRLARCAGLDELHAAPGNPGIAGLGSCHPVHAEDGEGLLALARALGIDLAVVGPEAPLVAASPTCCDTAVSRSSGPVPRRRASRARSSSRRTC